jgi:putative phosphonoacetaldehyde dehydrogenase|tara:strand:- start:1854 stop:3305 length:1452 start_codon:yes stop_codon:yes gene_type:complete
MIKNKIINESMRIGGQKISTDNKIDVFYPFTGELVGTVPAGQISNVQDAFSIASEYSSKLNRYERQQILFKTADSIKNKKLELAKLLTLELGISHQHAIYETSRAYDVFMFAGQLSTFDDGQIFSCDLTSNGKSRKIYTLRKPVRSISAITPFNHPLNMVAHKVAPAIATNNCMVCKPTELTPLTAIFLADILYEAGLPPEMFQIVTGWPEDIGNEMVTNSNADIITFTGSVQVGKKIAKLAGYKRTALELGGNDPFIILNDLSNNDDLKRAASIAIAGATGNSGQRCTAIKRILVQEDIADFFVEILLEKVKKIKYGDPQNPDTELGCVISKEAAKLFEERVIQSQEDGAEILYHPERKGALLPPIVVDKVPYKCELVVEETFGPIVPIIRVPNDDDEVIKISNSTAFGLSSGVCTNDINRAIKYINSLDVGTVNIWEQPGYRIELSPFGGIKDSGNGIKEGVLEAMKFFTYIKTYSLPWPT